MANKRKILETARKHVQKGARDKALKEYEKLLKLDPKDARLRIEIGDAYRRWGQTEDAIATYTKVAQQYMAEGFDARAVAVYKQIQNLDPEHWPSYEPLAELYQRMGLSAEAVNTLRLAADGLHRAGDKRQALELLRKMAAIDPSHTASRLKVADLLRQESMHEEAVAEYEGVVEELLRQGEEEQAGGVLETILEVEPDRVPTLVQLVENLMSRRLPQQAEPFARRAVEADSGAPEHYERLAEVYRAQDRNDALPDLYRRLAEVYRGRGDEDRARDILQRFVHTDGFAADAAPEAGLDGESLLEDDVTGDVSEFLSEDEFGPETLLEEEFIAGEGDPVTRPAPKPVAEETVLVRGEPEAPDDPDALELEDDDPEPATAAPPAPPAATGEPDQLFAEACVYLRYGKRAQAVANLEAILAGHPEHRGALEKLGEAHAEGDEPGRAVELWLRAAACARADADETGLAVLRDRIAALDPEAAATLGPAPDPDSEPEAPAAAPEPDAEPEIDEIEIDVDDSELEALAEDAELGGEEAPAPAERSASASSSQQLSEDLEEADFYVQQGLLDEAAGIYRRVLERAPNHPQALVRLGEIHAARGGDPAAETGGGAPPEARAEPHPEVPEVQRQAAEPPGGELDLDAGDWTDDLTEDDGEVEIEIPEPDAGDAADRAVDPDAETDLDLDDTPASLELDAAGAAADPVPAAEAPVAARDADADAGGGPDATADADPDLDLALPAVSDTAPVEGAFDLAAELNEVLDEDASGSTLTGLSSSEDDLFSAVFAEFKKGVKDALSESDHEAHYDLGIAYREMGLLDDAMAEFRTALASPARRLDCLQMLGLCALEQGAAEDAVGQFEMALATDDINAEQQLAMRFELGRAFDAMGDLEAARGTWEAVAAQDPTFCDVEERLAALADREKAEPDDADTLETESYESFDDFLDEDDGGAAPEPADAPAADEGGEPPALATEDFSDLIEEVNAEPDPGEAAGAAAGGDAEPPAEAPEPAPEPPASAESPQPEAPKRRKKKISFV